MRARKPGANQNAAKAGGWTHSGATANVLMLLTTIFWASNIVAGKFALKGMSPMALTLLRMGAAAILYWAILIATRGIPSLSMIRRHWRVLSLMALMGVTLNQIFYIGGLSLTSVTHTGLIQAVGPVFVLLLAGFLGEEPITGLKIAGMAISFAGVAVLLVEKSAPGSGSHWQGDLLLVGAAAVFAYYTILMKKVSNVYDSLTLNAYVFGFGSIFLIPFCAYPVSQVHWAQVPLQSWLGLAFMVVFASVIAYLIFGFALQELAASTVAAFSYLQPVIAAALAVWMLHEKITTRAVAGGVLIMAGLYLTERERGEKKHIKRLAHGGV